MNLKQRLKEQFGNPHGLLGYVAGWVMASSNKERAAWAVSLLELQPDDALLEVGVGPGLSLEVAAQQVGRVCAVDVSAVMIKQASNRNRAAIQNGIMELHQADVVDLPFDDNAFTKALTVNSLHHWPQPEPGIREVYRVLKPGGHFVVVQQPRSGMYDFADIINRISSYLSGAGFRDIRSAQKPNDADSTQVIAVIGVK